VVSTSEDADSSFEVALRWTGGEFRQAHVRAAIFVLVGSFAEVSTYVRQRPDGTPHEPGGSLSFDVVTGILDGESSFDPHGHTMRISVSKT
jgi:hypothetical protein